MKTYLPHQPFRCASVFLGSAFFNSCSILLSAASHRCTASKVASVQYIRWVWLIFLDVLVHRISPCHRAVQCIQRQSFFLYHTMWRGFELPLHLRTICRSPRCGLATLRRASFDVVSHGIKLGVLHQALTSNPLHLHRYATFRSVPLWTCLISAELWRSEHHLIRH